MLSERNKVSQPINFSNPEKANYHRFAKTIKSQQYRKVAK